MDLVFDTIGVTGKTDIGVRPHAANGTATAARSEGFTESATAPGVYVRANYSPPTGTAWLYFDCTSDADLTATQDILMSDLTLQLAAANASIAAANATLHAAVDGISVETSDPWATSDLSSYANGTAGATLHKLNITGNQTGVLPVPAPTGNVSTSTVHGRILHGNGTPAANITLQFALEHPSKKAPFTIAATGDVVSTLRITATTNGNGSIGNGSAASNGLALIKNGAIKPAGTVWRVVSPDAGLGRTIICANATESLGNLTIQTP